MSKVKRTLDDPELMEKLADIEHERWSSWMRYLFSKCDNDGRIPEWAVRHWGRQTATPYAELTEKEKEEDRKQVRNSLDCIKDHLSGSKYCPSWLWDWWVTHTM